MVYNKRFCNAYTWKNINFNDPKDTSQHTLTYLQKNNINIITWPSQNPELNPIENLWSLIKNKLKGKDFARILIPNLTSSTSPIIMLN